MKTKILLIFTIAACLFAGNTFGQSSVTVTINPSPVIEPVASDGNCSSVPSYSTGICIGNPFSLKSVISRVTLSGTQISEGTNPNQYTVEFYSDAALTTAISATYTPVASGCTAPFYAKVIQNESTCYAVYEFTLDASSSPALTLLDDEKSVCVAYEIDLIDAFIDLSGFTNYTYTDKATLANDLTFYSDAAGTIPLPPTNYLYTPTQTDLTNGEKKIYAKLSNGTCTSIIYTITLIIYEQPEANLTAGVTNASVCEDVAVNLAQYATATPSSAALQFSTSSDFSTLLPTSYTPTTAGNQTIYVRAVIPGVDLACATSSKSFTLTVHPKITDVKLALGTGGTPGTEDQELCEDELTGDIGSGSGTVNPLLKLEAEMIGGSGIFSDLKYKIDSGTETTANPNAGNSKLTFAVDAEVDGVQRIYTITYAKDNKGCEWRP